MMAEFWNNPRRILLPQRSYSSWKTRFSGFEMIQVQLKNAHRIHFKKQVFFGRERNLMHNVIQIHEGKPRMPEEKTCATS